MWRSASRPQESHVLSRHPDLLTPRYQVVGGLTAIDAGIALLPLADTMAVGGLIGPVSQGWFAQQYVIIGGMFMVAFGPCCRPPPRGPVNWWG